MSSGDICHHYSKTFNRGTLIQSLIQLRISSFGSHNPRTEIKRSYKTSDRRGILLINRTFKINFLSHKSSFLIYPSPIGHRWVLSYETINSHLTLFEDLWEVRVTRSDYSTGCITPVGVCRCVCFPFNYNDNLSFPFFRSYMSGHNNVTCPYPKGNPNFIQR